VILFKSKDDSDSAKKILRSIVEEVEMSYDMEIYNKIREDVRKNPITIVKKLKAPNPLPFMHLGADTEAVQPEKKHRQSVINPSSNQALREELNEDIQARQRIYSEQVLDPSESTPVGYQSKFQHYSTNEIIKVFQSMQFKNPEESPMFSVPEHIQWSIRRELPRTGLC